MTSKHNISKFNKLVELTNQKLNQFSPPATNQYTVQDMNAQRKQVEVYHQTFLNIAADLNAIKTDGAAGCNGASSSKKK